MKALFFYAVCSLLSVVASYGIGVPTGHSDIGLTLKNTAVEAVNLDIDEDGMEDAWEESNNLNTLWNDAELDWDRDGHTSLQEFLAGSDPQDGAAFFKATIEGILGTTMELSCPSVAGRNYQLYQSEDLVNWTLLGPVQTSTPPKNTFQVEIDTTAGSKSFYQIKVSQ